MRNEAIVQFSTVVNGKTLHADVLDITPGDAVNIKFSDGYQDQFIFSGEDGDVVMGQHFEPSSPYAAAIQKDMQVFTYPVQWLSIWRMPHQSFGNIWIMKNNWENEMHYGIFYDGKFQTDLQRIYCYGQAQFIEGSPNLCHDEAILMSVKAFIEEKEDPELHDAMVAAELLII